MGSTFPASECLGAHSTAAQQVVERGLELVIRNAGELAPVVGLSLSHTEIS
jgi:hypothetical protein